MDANELNMAWLDAQGRQAAATAAATDPGSAQVIREAREQHAREQAKFFVEADESLATLKCRTLDDLDPLLPLLQSLNFPAYGRAVVLGNRLLGRPDTPTIRFQRHEWDRWFARFDDVAQRLGYTRKR